MLPHISVCIITFKRPEFLRRLLESLKHQETGGLFSYSVAVVDNDREESAKPVVAQARLGTQLQMEYRLEPEKNLSLARNRALRAAHGDFAAFIDDDEFPVERWLLELHRTYCTFKSDGVLGPVEPHFEIEPPGWIVRSKVFQRPRYPTGRLLDWNETRTGNVLLKRDLADDEGNLFNPAFGKHGEDRDFFKRLIQKGHKFVWCDEAVAYETQPPERLTRKYHLRRALLRGSIAYAHAPAKMPAVLTSVVAFGLYTAALPLLQISGHHNFMKYLVKDCDHIGRILACLGYKVEKHMKFL
jgi:glycosyltransferase involved in cell wall biosynthesis